ncbi:hypothetical protein ACLOJK_039993 [Asimina triloba]
MSDAEIRLKPPSTTLSPYTVREQTSSAEATKQHSNKISDSQYWRYDVSQKRQRQGSEDSARLCFKFTSTGSCPQEEKCNFRHDMDAREWYMKGGCFDFINRGKCERGSECSFRHGEGDSLSQKKLSNGFCLLIQVIGLLNLKTDGAYPCDLEPTIDGAYAEDFSDKNEKGAMLDIIMSCTCICTLFCFSSYPFICMAIVTLRGVFKAFCTHMTGSGNHSESRGRECWFCLSSTNVESHLVLSIGESCYCALAKGPLVEDHLLIIPVDHSPNTLSLPPEAENELQIYKDALKTCFKNQRKTVVFYEWLSKPGPSMHANLQVVPIPLSKAFEIRRHFVLAAKHLGFEFEFINPSEYISDPHEYIFGSSSIFLPLGLAYHQPDQCNHPSDGRKSSRGLFDGKSTFFYVELPEGTILYHSVGAQEKFPAQFGREVLAGMLNMTERADWRNCKLSKEEETQMVESFKKQFEEFDPAR